MATKRLPRPRDPISLAKLIGDIATGQVVDVLEDGRKDIAIESGREGGVTGAKNLTSQRRTEIASRAAAKRCGNSC